jgi:hypothetical protein
MIADNPFMLGKPSLGISLRIMDNIPDKQNKN